MKTSAIFILCLSIVTKSIYAQKIEGFVKDAESKQPLPYASVFIGSTTLGTSTDSTGFFKLQNIPVGNYTLIVSYLGYNSFQISVEIKAGKDTKLELLLQPNKKALDGESAASKLCKILNPWVIDFESDGNTLTAKASDFIVIDNQYLGYQIEYSLKNFKWDGSQTSIGGYARFIPLGTTENQKRETWNQNRQKAYRNSEIYFVNALIKHQAKNAGFEAFIDKPGNNPLERSPFFYQNQLKKLSPISLDSLMTKDEKTAHWRLTLPRRVEIQLNGSEGSFSIYRDKLCQVAWIESSGKPLIFNQNGLLLNPQDWAIAGYLTNGRITEMLPLDFIPAAEITQKSKPNFWAEQIEKPFFTTDKSYYFKGDTIQIGGMMHYSNPEKMGSMSRILNLELVNPKTHQIIAKQKTQINEDGSFQSVMAVSDSILKQTYLLRAYTRWMRNWGDSVFSYRWLPIISKYENIKNDLPIKEGSLSITPSDSLVSIEIPQSEGTSFSWLSASVVDNETVKQFDVTLKTGIFPPLPNALKPIYYIERGIDLMGKVLDRKASPAANANVILIISKTGQSFIATTDSNGVFQFDNLPIENQQQILVKASDAKNKAIPNIEINAEKAVSTVDYGTIPQIITEQSETPVSVVYAKSSSYSGIQLKEVEVKAKKTTVSVPPKNIYGGADYVLEGNTLAKAAISENILTALQGRVPGLTLVEKYDDYGFRQLIITLRGGNASNGLQIAVRNQPLILVDGVPFEDVNQLLAIPTSRIASVEIYNKSSNMAGLRGYHGIIAVYTKKISDEERNEFVKDANIKSLIINGIASVRKTTFSSVFHWQPDMIINPWAKTTYQFPKPPKGSYAITIEGLNKQGKIEKFQTIYKNER